MSKNNIKEQLESCINSISDDFVCVVNNYELSRVIDLLEDIKSFHNFSDEIELSFNNLISLMSKEVTTLSEYDIKEHFELLIYDTSEGGYCNDK